MNSDSVNVQNDSDKGIKINGATIDPRLINRVESIHDVKNKRNKPFFYPPSLENRIQTIPETNDSNSNSN